MVSGQLLIPADAGRVTMGQKTNRDRYPLEGWDIPLACAAVIVILITWGILAGIS